MYTNSEFIPFSSPNDFLHSTRNDILRNQADYIILYLILYWQSKKKRFRRKAEKILKKIKILPSIRKIFLEI